MDATVASEKRYLATRLADVIDAQGRRKDWLAEKARVHETFIGKVAARQRTIGAAEAERIALALGVPFFLLFELHEGNETNAHVETDAAD